MMLPLLVVLQAKAVLDTQRVSARREETRAGQAVVAVQAREARERGATTVAGLLAIVPFVQQRTARGELSPSVRAARREQVVVTLDGLPLNDPATGVADLADLPLVMLDQLVVRSGAAPVDGGSGAVGGVMALSTAARSALSLGVASSGQRTVEGMCAGAQGRTKSFVAMSRRTGRNDFPFLNAAGAEPVSERRINNDEQRTNIAVGWRTPRHQLMTIMSHGERGMVGAANVRAYDQDRASTARALLRAQTVIGATVLRAGLRHFALAYRDLQDPLRDARSQVTAADLEWSGMVAGGSWRIGGGHDALHATGDVNQNRARAFAAWERQAVVSSRVVIDAGGRFDAVHGTVGTPTGNLGVSVSMSNDTLAPMWRLHGRVARALRVPTLYDLFFHSPQRVSVRALRPERVIVDGSVGTRVERTRDRTRWQAEWSVVHRRTADAIVWFPGNFGWSPANAGREILNGAELRSALERPRVALSAWGTWYDARLVSGGLQIPTPYVARVNGALLSQWRPTERWRGSAQWRWQGRRPYTAGPRNAAFELPAVQLLDLAISRRVGPSAQPWLVSVALDNAMNVGWQSVRGFPMPGRSWSVTTSWPAR